MVIIASYFAGETYGLLGPQVAATIIQDNTPYDCIVLALTRDDNKALLKKAVADFFGKQRSIIGFSYLSGREDLFTLAREFKDEGAFTILAGPQADVDFQGEKNWRRYQHRFSGLSKSFSCALYGPAEQIISLLRDLDTDDWQNAPGIIFHRKDGTLVHNPKKPWAAKFLSLVRWDNLYRLEGNVFAPLRVSLAQVLQQIGCPHAARERSIEIPYPAALGGRGKGSIRLLAKGCSFCDVAVDKGFTATVAMDTVLSQIRCLPDTEGLRKIPFEIINEKPLPGLRRILEGAHKHNIRLSQINLTMRADWFVAGEKHLRSALAMAKGMNVRILLSSVGFESFDDSILAKLNKDLTVNTNLRAVQLMRQLKDEFPHTWGYSRADGAIHGFIHPTPWDTTETEANNQKSIALHNLASDILPDHSTPLIIHHASRLGDWIREIELKEGIGFQRYVSTIGWWKMQVRDV